MCMNMCHMETRDLINFFRYRNTEELAIVLE